MKRHIKTIALGGAIWLIAACGGLQPAGTSTAMLLEYQTHPTNYNLADLAKSYANTIKYNSKRDTCQPGLFAEYGVALALLGKNSEANKMFNSEIAAFPNSARYVRQLKLALVPEYVSDTVTDTNTMFDIDLGDYSDSTAKEAVEPDPIERLQAREQAKKDREAAKLQQQAAKEKAKEERDLVKAIREKEKIARDRQREAVKEQREAEKERQQKLKKQQAKERKVAKKEQERLKEQQRAEREAAKMAAKEEKERQREELKAAREQQREKMKAERETERERAKAERERAKSQSDEEADSDED